MELPGVLRILFGEGNSPMVKKNSYTIGGKGLEVDLDSDPLACGGRCVKLGLGSVPRTRRGGVRPNL